MKSSIHIRAGVFRIWLVLSVVWVLFAVWHWESDIGYAYRFFFHRVELTEGLREAGQQIKQARRDERDELSQRHEAAIARFRQEEASEYGQNLKRAGLPLTPPTPDLRIATLTKLLVERLQDEGPSHPELLWIVAVTAPPFAVALAFVLLFQVVKWIWRGFYGQR